MQTIWKGISLKRFILFLLVALFSFSAISAEMNRLTYAKLCRYTYESKDRDLCGLEYLGDVEKAFIRFCYFRNPSDERNFLAIRGSDNTANWIGNVELVFGGGEQKERLCRATREALEELEDRHGPCSGAAGHSLGGKALEYLPSHIKCVAFNAFYNDDRPNISSVRVRGDHAGNHTDVWIGSEPRKSVALSVFYASVVPYAIGSAICHSIDTVIEELEKD